MTTPTVRAYLRVSTDAQDTANQAHGVDAYAAAAGFVVSETIHDTASGSTPWQDRPIAALIESAQPGEVLLVAEISRLARSTLQVLEIMRAAALRGMVIHVIKSRLVMDGSMQSKIIGTVLGLAAEIEREFIVARTRESLRRRAAAGLPMGRPPGEASRLKLDAKAAEIDKLFAAGLGKSSVAKLLDCSRGTLDTWLQRRRPDLL